MWQIIQGDSLETLRTLPDESVHCCITSPPYWGLRDYGIEGQIGLEKTIPEYIEKLTEVFREVRRVLRSDGTCWVNMGDSYISSATGNSTTKSTLGGGLSTQVEAGKRPDKKCDGLKPKNLCGIPWRLALALQDDGWYLRMDIIWNKTNPMTESVKDRPTKSHEYLFLFSKSVRYYYDYFAVMEKTRYGHANSPESIKSPYGQGFTRRAQKDKIPSGWYTGPGNHNGKKGRYDQFGGNKHNESTTKHSDGSFYTEREYRNLRSVWTLSTEPFPGPHFATFPKRLVKIPIVAGCPRGGTVLDPFCGAGTTGLVALRLGRQFIGIELKPEYKAMAEKRIMEDMPLFNQRQEVV